jgi:hypothetical protein
MGRLALFSPSANFVLYRVAEASSHRGYAVQRMPAVIRKLRRGDKAMGLGWRSFQR